MPCKENHYAATKLQDTKYDCIPVYDFTKPVNEDWVINKIGLYKYKEFIKDEMKSFGYKTR